MSKMEQFRKRDASLWQSAVDEVVAKENAASSPAAGFGPGASQLRRPEQAGLEILHTNEIARAIDAAQQPPDVPPPSPAAGVADTVKFCATAAFKLAEARVKALLGDDSELKRVEEELKAPFGNCDPKWAQVVQVYVQSKIDASTRTIPYVRYSDISDFVIDDGRLPDPATVALIGDWGTGQDGARKLLAKVAMKKPDVVMHLGDVYYSGTDSEVKNYFYAIWQKVLGIPKVAWGSELTDTKGKPATFHLAGNHDMYAGGGPYYTVIRMLGQPASYFCLRNRDWQFIALDTGLHDSNPLKEGTPTFLEDTEVAWLKDKVRTAGGRKTVLLSHHQLFSRFDAVDQKSTNETLLGQVQDVLPQVTVWFWGHEHNLVIYKRFLNVLGRCIGHGAFPVPVDLPTTSFDEVPIENVSLARDNTGGLFQHGYVLLNLNGKAAKATYYQYDADSDREMALYTEGL